KVYDHHNELLGMFGKDLQNIHRIDISGLDARLVQVDIKVASDVDNPLCGDNGATVVYGPQKGITDDKIHLYDSQLDLYSNQLENLIGESYKQREGAGAAGGLGFALMILGANIESGAQLVAEANQMETALCSADMV